MNPFFPPEPAINRVLAQLHRRPAAARPGTPEFRAELNARDRVARTLLARLALARHSQTVTLAHDEAFELLDDFCRLLDCAELLHEIERVWLDEESRRLAQLNNTNDLTAHSEVL